MVSVLWKLDKTSWTVGRDKATVRLHVGWHSRWPWTRASDAFFCVIDQHRCSVDAWHLFPFGLFCVHRWALGGGMTHIFEFSGPLFLLGVYYLGSYCKEWSSSMNVLVLHPQSHTHKFFCLPYIIRNKGYRTFFVQYKKSKFKIFTFDTFSVSHTLINSVTNMAFLKFCL